MIAILLGHAWAALPKMTQHTIDAAFGKLVTLSISIYLPVSNRFGMAYMFAAFLTGVLVAVA